MEPGPAKWTRGPTDWDCPVCRNVNFAKRVTCNRCDTPKPGSVAMGTGNPVFGQGGGDLAPSSLGGKARFPTQPGDWCCPNVSCGNVNWAKRSTCNLCGAPRPEEQAIASLPSAPSVSYPKIPPNMGPEDWLCSNCRNVNFARRLECNLCGSPRSQSLARPPTSMPAKHLSAFPTASTSALIGRETTTVAAKWSPMPGDWNCPHCANVNFYWRDICNRCHTLRSDWPECPDLVAPFPPTYRSAGSAPKKPFRVLETDWTCSECKNVNFGWRGSCNRCNCAKPSVGAAGSARNSPY
eukprot:RCo005625